MNYKFSILISLFSIIIVSCNAIKPETHQQLIAENNILKDSLVFYKQQFADTPKAVFELEKMNVVYRGIKNQMKIVVPNSIRFSAIAPGLKNMGNGHFDLRPQFRKEVTIRVVAQMKNGKVQEFQKVFQIHEIGSGAIAINDIKFEDKVIELTKAKIQESYFSLYVKNYLPYKLNKIDSFSVLFPRKENVAVKGNTFSKEANKALSQMQTGDTIHIVNVKTLRYFGVRVCKISPLSIKIIEK